MSRRANLPGADELFRRTGAAVEGADRPTPAGPAAGSAAGPGGGTGGAAGPGGSGGNDALTAHLASFAQEDEVLAEVRRRALESGVPVPAAATGATLSFLAAAVGARSAVAIGSGGGVAALWLLRGMQQGGVLTAVDESPEEQRLVKRALADGGIPGARSRSIVGTPADVLPRLSDGAYDLVSVDSVPTAYPALLPAVVRLLRPGGVLVFGHALWHGRVLESVARDAETLALRDLRDRVLEEHRLQAVLLPAGDGLLAAVRRDVA